MREVTITFDHCEECPLFKCTAAWFAHCTHPKIVATKDYPERRVRHPNQCDKGVPKWCPLEEK